jgi:hypothetical protein
MMVKTEQMVNAWIYVAKPRSFICALLGERGRAEEDGM